MIDKLPATQYDHIRKRIVICCDGTWQSSVSGEKNIPSNVTRLVRHLAMEGVTKDKASGEVTLWKQVVFYDPGIGTGDLSFLDVVRQGGTGAGLAHNVFECYNFIVNNYEPGDKLYCFGFSRGAYTARSLCGFITLLGICHPLDMMAFPQVYDMYEAALPERQGESTKARKTREAFYGKFDSKNKLVESGMIQKWLNGERIEIDLGDRGADGTVKFVSRKRDPIPEASKHIEVVGVWDTVGSLGVPKIFGWFRIPFLILNKPGREFHDVGIHKNVKYAYHAMALDERRLPFSPTLWYSPKEQNRSPESFKQVWFPGCHINVGGGNDDVLSDKRSDFEQLSNITFAWMIQQCRPHLTFDMNGFRGAVEQQRSMLESLKGCVQPIPKTWYKPVVWIWRKMYTAFGYPEPVLAADGGWGIGPVVDSYSSAGLSIKLGGLKVRTPGEVEEPESISNTEPRALTKKGDTNEEIHPCVWYRFQATDIPKTASLKNWHRVANKTSTKGWEWKKNGVSLVLPESRIEANPSDDPDEENFERVIARANGAEGYLAKLDQMYESGVDKTFEPFETPRL